LKKSEPAKLRINKNQDSQILVAEALCLCAGAGSISRMAGCEVCFLVPVGGGSGNTETWQADRVF